MARRGNFHILDSFNHYVPGFGSGIGMLVLMFLAGALLGNAVELVLMKLTDAATAQEYGTLLAYPVMFLVPMVYTATKSRLDAFRVPGVKLDSSHFGASGGFVCALVASVLVLAMGFCADFFNSLLPPMPEWLENVLKGLTQGNVWLNLLCVSVFAPFCEEWLCRGMVMRGLMRRNVSPFWSIVISAIFFAVIHLNPWQAIPALVFGILFGYVYYKTGSLKLTMLMHCVNNTLAVVLGQIDSLKDMDNWMEVLPVPSYWIVFAGCLLLSVLGIRFFAKIPQDNPLGNLDEV